MQLDSMRKWLCPVPGVANGVINLPQPLHIGHPATGWGYASGKGRATKMVVDGEGLRSGHSSRQAVSFQGLQL